MEIITVRDIIDEEYEECGTVLFENPSYDSALIGVEAESCRAVYDFDLMVEELVKDGMTDIEAIEFIEYNTMRALPYAGKMAPIIIYDFRKGIEDDHRKE